MLGLAIRYVIDTHLHADHISGNRELAAATRAPILAHRAAGLAFEHEAVADGDRVRLGNVELTVAHTPGHTPDSIALLVTDHARGGQPWFALTGDTLFVGSVGRPDLGGRRWVRRGLGSGWGRRGRPARLGRRARARRGQQDEDRDPTLHDHQTAPARGRFGAIRGAWVGSRPAPSRTGPPRGGA